MEESIFQAYGTEGLDLFVWVVAGLIGIVAALGFAHFLRVNKAEETEEEEHPAV